jgi:hypothetical protein
VVRRVEADGVLYPRRRGGEAARRRAAEEQRAQREDDSERGGDRKREGAFALGLGRGDKKQQARTTLVARAFALLSA